MRPGILAFSLGICLGSLVPVLPPAHWLPLALVVPLLSLRFPVLRLAGAYSLGVFWSLAWGAHTMAGLLPARLEKQDIWVTGVVSGLPQTRARGTRLSFTIERRCEHGDLAACDFDRLPRRRDKILINHYGSEAMAPAQRWRLKLRLQRPHGFANPGGFDYEAWLLQQGFTATGYIREDPGNKLLRPSRGLDADRLRHAFRVALAELFPGRKEEEGGLSRPGLVRALTIGDRQGISQALWDVFSATGTNHLVVISGLHVGLVALLFHRLAAWAMRLVPRMMLYVPAPRAGALAAIGGALFYSALAGFSLPTRRACLMVLALMWGRVARRETRPANGFCLALAAVLALNPLAARSTGFWLSFAAVAVLIFLVPGRTPKTEPPRGMGERCLTLMRAQGSLFLGLFPLLGVFFQQVSLLAPAVNLFAIPFVSLAVVPLCLLGLVLAQAWKPGAAMVLHLADELLESLVTILTWLVDRLPWATVSMPALPWWALAMLAGATALLLSPAKRRFKALALAGFLPLFADHRPAVAPGSFTLHVLDVGQGLAAVVETAGHILVYDTGPAYSPAFEAGGGILLPFLRARNLKEVDAVVVSHGDNDHAGGLPAVARRFPAARYYGGGRALGGGDGRGEACRRDSTWQWDGVMFRFLHPDGRFYTRNNASCVLRISAGDRAVLLPGDIERRVERRLVNGLTPARLSADVLVAPHHGSRTSSTAAFLAAVDPAHAVFASGYLNRFGHPHGEVLARYRRAGIRHYNTASTGALSFHIMPGRAVAAPRRWRAVRPRYWDDPDNNSRISE